MGLHEIKNLHTTKEMVPKLKRPSTGWEKIFVAIHQRTDNLTIQGAQKTNFPNQ
jgi:hypothetical protein